MQKDQSVAIIGMGCIFPKANGQKEYWQLLFNSGDAISQIPETTHFALKDYFNEDPAAADHIYCSRGGFIPAVTFDPSRYGIPPKNLDATDTSQLLGLVVAEMALKDAGYGTKQRTFDKNRTSIILGVTGTQELVIPLGARLDGPVWEKALAASGIPEEKRIEIIQKIKSAYPEWQENSFPGLLGNVVAGRIANKLDLGGTNSVVDAACASSLGALNNAVLELLSGRSDMSVTGGVDTLNDVFMHMCFSKTGVLSHTSDARPFSRDADGTVLGEGIGMIVLKRLSDAVKDNDRIYAIIKGIGTSSDGNTGGIYTPDANGQIRALEAAYSDASVDPASVKLIEAHGTGTRMGDKTEFSALKTFFEKSAGTPLPKNSIALGSVKSNIGHTKAAAGIAGIIKSALALYHKVLLPTLKVSEPDPALHIDESPFYLNTQAVPWINPEAADTPRRSGVSAFGFGGSNFHAVLQEHSPVKDHVSWDGSVYIAAFSAHDRPTLTRKITDFRKKIAPAEDLDSREYSQTIGYETALLSESFSSDAPFRLVIVIHRPGDPLAVLAEAIEISDNREWDNGSGHPDIYLGSGNRSGKLGFLFPGQGSQYVQMGRDLVSVFPEALAAFTAADHCFRDANPDQAPKALHDYIYPPGSLIKNREPFEAQLRETGVAQAAIGALSLAMTRILNRFNIVPDMTCGHSFGELTALVSAGWMDDASFLNLACLRGKYMSRACNRSNDNGGMLAVKAPIDQTEKVLRDHRLNLVLANRNAHTQGVVSGSSGEIEKALEIFKEHRMKAVKLPVSAAFHTHKVEDAARPFAGEIDHTPITPTRVPVLSNTTGSVYPRDPEAVKRILGQQLVTPVNFIENIETMAENEVSTFIEVGPKPVLTGLVKSILKGKDVTVAALDKSSGKNSGIADLASVLAALAAGGYNVNLAAWEGPFEQVDSKRMCVHITGANPKIEPKFSPSPASGETPVKKKEINKKRKGTNDPSPNTMQSKGSDMSSPNRNETMTYEALKMVQKGLEAMQALQQQTASAHEKFLETQARASESLQHMMNQTKSFADGITAPMQTDRPAGVFASKPAESPDTREYDDITVPGAAAPDFQPEEPAPFYDTTVPEERRSQAAPEIPETPQQNPVPASDLGQEKAGTNYAASILIQTVSTLTGFPEEMLEPDMDLESDLGIDSIKRVEILSELEKKIPEIGAISPDDITGLKTIDAIAGFLEERVLQTNADTGVANPPSHSPKHSSSSGKKPQSEETGYFSPHDAPDRGETAKKKLSRKSVILKKYPVDQIRFYNGLRVKIAQGKKIYITRDSSGLSAVFSDCFQKEGLTTELVDLSADDVPQLPDAGGLVIVADDFGHDGIQPRIDFMKKVFLLARENGHHLLRSASESGAFFATVSFLGGAFGFDETPFDDPVQGGLAGLAKTAGLEWKDVLCKAVDMPGSLASAMEMAESAVSIMMTYGAAEIGMDGDVCNLPELADQAAGSEKPLDISKDDVFVITGGAKGVTAECAVRLAEKFSPVMVLIGRSPAPFDDPEWLTGLTGEKEIKQAILENKFRNATPRPAELENAYREIVSNRDINHTLRAIKEAGSEAIYFSADIRDKEKITQLLTDTRQKYGKITGVIHGSGILEDKLIVEKDYDKFCTVFDTKVLGLESVVSATENDPLKYFVCFSSVAARTGNAGQSDYAMANEILNKKMQKMARTRDNCRCISVNWGPWNGGMVNGPLKKKFSREGIDLIDPRSGAEHLLYEMGSGKREDVEIVVGKNIFAQTAQTGKSSLAQAFRYTVSESSVPVLDAHRIAGRRVVPFALLMEWQAYAAQKNNPGLVFAGMDRMRLLKGIKMAPDETVTLTFKTGKCRKIEDRYETETYLFSDQFKNDNFMHASCISILKETLPAPPVFSAGFSPDAAPSTMSREKAYHEILFHGEAFQAITAINGCSAKGIDVTAVKTPSAEKWLNPPHAKKWTTDPLLFDAAFQAVILWTYETRQGACLPVYIANVRIYNTFHTSGSRIRILFTVNEETDHKIKGYITFLDNDTVIASITGFEAIVDPALVRTFQNEPALIDRDQILAFAEGNPSDAFGEAYQVFDSEREMARLPRPPYFFMDRITRIDHEKWQLAPGGWIESQFDIPENGWYFNANGSDTIPFCILLEIALQPCGWLAAWAGSALTSGERLYFRNLGGEARLLKSVHRHTGTVTVCARMTQVSRGGGMIIQEFDMAVKQRDTLLYTGHTSFGFFTGRALSNQVGIRESELFLYEPSPDISDDRKRIEFSDTPPVTPFDERVTQDTDMPAKALRMIDAIHHFSFSGGVYNHGYIHAVKEIDPKEWFFDAHFYQDPVCPGSLGIESFLQLLRFYARQKWDIPGSEYDVIPAENTRHKWTYRGQITPENKMVSVVAHIRHVSEADRRITADGAVAVDGICIYEMTGFTVQAVKTKARRSAEREKRQAAP